nr:hypothetical protein HmN_000959700 [Hymenolepis microstoma]
MWSYGVAVYVIGTVLLIRKPTVALVLETAVFERWAQTLLTRVLVNFEVEGVGDVNIVLQRKQPLGRDFVLTLELITTKKRVSSLTFLGP